MPAIPIYPSAGAARQTLLRRYAPEDTPVPDDLSRRIAALFGTPLTPAQAVAEIVADVRRRGGAGLREWSQRLDGYDPEAPGAPPLAVSDLEIVQAYDAVPADVVQALEEAADRINQFHERQPVGSWLVEGMGGLLGQFVRAIERAAVLLPGGPGPQPSALLMAALPARVAGVDELIVCTPPGPGGAVAPALLVAADIAQVQTIYRIGGAQAVAALAYGIGGIPRVDKIVGAGDLFATLAKQAVAGAVGTDGPAGPSDLLIIADDGARAEWIAADLLAQAEHATLAAAVLVTPSRALAEAVQAEVDTQLAALASDGGAAEALAARGGIVVTADLGEAVTLADDYAPARLALFVRDPWDVAQQVRHAGMLFLGEHSYPVLGEFVAGPGQVLPAWGGARFASPLSVLDFVRLTGFVGLRPDDALEWGVVAETLARAEGLAARAAAAARRRAGSELDAHLAARAED
jgi:histidinol dehydrogenase